MTEVFLHIGLHKTATTTLQRQFFPACKDLEFFTTVVPEMRTFVDLVTKKDPLYFDAAETRRMIAPVLSRGKPNLLSNESFSGPPYAGVIEYGLDHRSAVLSNLKEVFPEAKAILVLRRQDALARSLFRQYLKVGGTRGIRAFYGMKNDGRLPLLSLDRFFFCRYVEEVLRCFRQGILVLTFEEFIENQSSFLEKLTNFIGIEIPSIKLTKENATTFGPFGLEVTRIFNHLFRSYLNPGGMIPGIPTVRERRLRWIKPIEILHDSWPIRAKRVSHGEIKAVTSEILEMVRADNCLLDRRYGLDLKRYRYY